MYRSNAHLVAFSLGLSLVGSLSAAPVDDLQRLQTAQAQHQQAGRHAEAAVALRQMATIVQRHFPEKLEMLANIQNQIGNCYFRQDSFAEAQPWFEKSIATIERAGPKPPATLAQYLHNLADCLWNQKSFDRCPPLYAQALKLRQELLGDDHEDTAFSRQELVLSYVKVGRVDEAEKVYRESIARQERKLGAEHAGTAKAVEQLARWLYEQDRSADAEPLYRRLLRIREKQHGQEHLDVAEAAHGLADTLYALRRFDEAESLYARVLQIREKAGAEEMIVAQTAHDLACAAYEQEKYEVAERHYAQAANLRAKRLGTEHLDTATSWRGQAQCFVYGLARPREGRKLLEKVLAIHERELGADDLEVAGTLGDLAYACGEAHAPADAERFYKRALTIREQQLGRDDPLVAATLSGLASVTQYGLADYAAAEKLYERVVSIREKQEADDPLELARALTELAQSRWLRGRNADAIALHERALKLREKHLPPDDPDVAWSLNGLGAVLGSQGRYSEAESLLRRALRAMEKRYGAEHPSVATVLYGLADLFQPQGRYAEAEPLYDRALRIREAKLGREHTDVAYSLIGLGVVATCQGRYAEAEPRFRQALAILEQHLPPEHPDLANPLNRLAECYVSQSRYADAEPVVKRAMNLIEKRHGPTHVDVAWSQIILGRIHVKQKRFAEAESLLQQALKTYRDREGASSDNVAYSLDTLALLETARENWARAETYQKEALDSRERRYGPTNINLTWSLMGLAEVYEKQARFAEAETLADRIIAIRDRSGASADDRCNSYHLRARLAWRSQRRNEAVADLRKAMDLAEQQRVHMSGTERERAGAFADFSAVFERMVDWQRELGDMNEALAAMERGRARSMLDELTVAGADLEVSLSAVEREKSRQREAELKREAATLVKQLEALTAKPGAAKQERERLEAALARTREKLYDHYREQRSGNRVYRNLLASDQGPPRITQLRRSLLPEGTLLLSYWFGEEHGFVLAIDSQRAELTSLALDAADAKRLRVEPGPLTAERLAAALVRADGTGIVQHLKHPQHAGRLTDELSILWRVLVPESYRRALTGGTLKRLMVVPDGHLALLPLETLVVGTGGRTSYLLESGPPIHYAPSVSVLFNLAQTPVPGRTNGRELVLTVGDPTYADAPVATSRGGSRYGFLGRKLTPLPYSGLESEWVRESFREHGVSVLRLTGRDATKLQVTSQAAGRRIVHLACHGFADQSFGNFFGALALTPPADATAETEADAFLTLAEIYGLNLKGCELTILSACDTNIGPQQRGEGVWALSRGFLVAGSRRVVASNWLVDDEAAAHLVTHFCGAIAESEKAGARTDYATALQSAKRWVRGQAKWNSPYFWAPCVLVGPN